MKRQTGGARAGALGGLCALGLVACTNEEPAGAARSLETRAQGVTSVAKVTAFSSATATKQDTLPDGFTEMDGFALFFSRTRKGLFRTDGTEAGTSLVRDLDPTVDSFQSAPRMVRLGTRAYWLLQGELWTSDGTPGGTRLMLDAPFPSSPTPPVVFNGALYFSVGTSLYRSDGTAQGTQVIATAAMKVTEDGFYDAWRVMGDRLYFACTLGTGSAGMELCATDGTGPGTVLIADVGPGSASGSPSLLGEVNGRLIFSAASTTTSRSLYATDGTDAGPIQLLHVANNYTVGTGQSNFATTLNGRAYLLCATPATGVELCATDGTAAGTQVLDLVPGSTSSNAKGMTRLGDRLYFSACTSQSGCELWSSDGTLAGSAMLKDILPGTAHGFPGPELLPVNGGLLFVALTPSGSGVLWKTDGTADGTVLLKDVVSPQASGGRYGLELTDGVRLGDALLFPADDGVHGQEVWRTDGTAAGTRMVTDVTPVQRDGDASGMRAFDDWLLLGAPTDTGQTGVWRSDGTASGTRPLAAAMGPSSYTPAMAPFGDRLLIARGQELWMTDATAAGTVRFKELPGSGAYGGVVQLPNQVGVFIGSTQFQTVGLWRTDGTDTGTQLTTPIVENARNMGVSNGKAYLTGLYSSLGNELYVSDGTPGGTAFLKDIYVGSKSSEPSGFTPLGTLTLFSADDGVAGRELWKTDGTAGGTARLADLNPGALSSSPTSLHPLGNRVVFWARSPTARLWTTDGTAQGTQPVGAAVTPGFPERFVTWGDVAFFAGAEATTGTELWRTDGTLEGTVQVADLQPGRGSSLPDQLTLVSPSGPLLFAAEDAVGGRELWRLDSPTGVPTRAADVVAGPGSSRPGQLTVNGSAVYFSASDGTGRALFRMSGLVPDTHPPRLGCPPDATVAATSATGAVVTFPAASVRDDSGEVPTARAVPASGGRFPPGLTLVTFSATDAAGNTGTCTFTVTVTPLPGADAGTADAGVPDAGPTQDAGSADAGSADAGTTDAGVPDAGPVDAGSTDAGPNGPGRDAGPGLGEPEPDSRGGCGCQETPVSAPWGLALAGLFAFARRSRKRRTHA
ncbi:HYR domain-containing protein [Corallococcus macrosporus]|uniref:HYR domain-containing protein n=1 Tax=Corallococcus macrosporus TaxID=35 RepID=A0ABS3D519_9BACT|nr:HYR domain-containing protein [Corallococcus macrosporus]MBN8226760.1 HYR domain-containing protein [Corallococcus macrosporus]